MLESFLKEQILVAVKELAESQFGITIPDLPPGFKLSPPPASEKGDYATNIAFLLSRHFRKSPLEIAQLLAQTLVQRSGIETVSVAGGGFLNITISYRIEAQLLSEFYEQWKKGTLFPLPPKRRRIYLEFVSANPTGPLHVGHGRIAAIGDTLARIYRRLGYEVHSEFYINDRGRQMDLLGESLRVRVGELKGVQGQIPEDGYQGEYMREIAQDFLRETSQLPEEMEFYREFALRWILKLIVKDLEEFRVHFDRYLSEEELYRQGWVEETLAILERTPYVSREEGALIFHAEQLGDEKPRVLIRQNAEPTYLAGDLAYHRYKFQQGYDEYINLWGADHHGYAPRLYAALKALGLPYERLKVLFVQFVTLLRGGKPVSMSTRSGEFTSLREVFEEVGVDAARYFYLRRRNDTHLEFDLDLARVQARENPVYYVQYAHARIASLRRKAKDLGVFDPGGDHKEFHMLTTPEERRLIRILLRYPDVLTSIAVTYEPHELTFYLEELANAFHTYYNVHRILDALPTELAQARFALASLTGDVIAEGLGLMGVESPERM